MSDFLLIYIFLALIVVIVIQGVERYFFAEQAQRAQDKLLDELSRATKAVIAKNANDYVMTTSIDKVAPEKPLPIQSDLIPEETLSDDEFMEAIGKVAEKE